MHAANLNGCWDFRPVGPSCSFARAPALKWLAEDLAAGSWQGAGVEGTMRWNSKQILWMVVRGTLYRWQHTQLCCVHACLRPPPSCGTHATAMPRCRATRVLRACSLCMLRQPTCCFPMLIYAARSARCSFPSPLVTSRLLVYMERMAVGKICVCVLDAKIAVTPASAAAAVCLGAAKPLARCPSLLATTPTHL